MRRSVLKMAAMFGDKVWSVEVPESLESLATYSEIGINVFTKSIHEGLVRYFWIFQENRADCA